MTTTDGQRRALRLDVDADELGRGLGRLVVALLDVVRQLFERQVLRRVDANTVTADQTERLGRALLDLEAGSAKLRGVFEVPDGPVDLPLRVVDLDEDERRPPPWQ